MKSDEGKGGKIVRKKEGNRVKEKKRLRNGVYKTGREEEKEREKGKWKR